MKIKNILCIIMASAMIFAMQSVGASQPSEGTAISAQEIGAAVDQIADKVREDLEVAINNTAQAIADATIIKNQAIVAGLENTKTSEEVKNIVDAQNALIMQIKQDLMKLAENGMATVDNAAQQASYMSQFATGAQQFGAWLWNPATENERELARQIIAMLEEAKKTEINPAIIQQLNQQINDQKLITGDKMSTRQMLLIGAVGTAAAIAGVTVVGSKFFGKTEMPQESGISPAVLNALEQQYPEVPLSKESRKIGREVAGKIEGKIASVKATFDEGIKGVKEATKRDMETMTQAVENWKGSTRGVMAAEDADLEKRSQAISEGVEQLTNAIEKKTAPIVKKIEPWINATRESIEEEAKSDRDMQEKAAAVADKIAQGAQAWKEATQQEMKIEDELLQQESAAIDELKRKAEKIIAPVTEKIAEGAKAIAQGAQAWQNATKRALKEYEALEEDMEE